MDGDGRGVRTGGGTGSVGMRTQMEKGSGREAGSRAAPRTGSVFSLIPGDERRGWLCSRRTLPGAEDGEGAVAGRLVSWEAELRPTAQTG